MTSVQKVGRTKNTKTDGDDEHNSSDDENIVKIESNNDATTTTSGSSSSSNRPNKHRTNRKVMLKLELTGDVANQLSAVNRTIFETDERNDIKFITPAEDSTSWPTVDEVLYSIPKITYDNIYKAFMSEPKVYKLDSVKEKVWQRAKQEMGDNIEVSLTTSWELPSKKKKKKKNKRNKDEIDPIEDVIKTYIDPFTDGDVEPIWKEKLHVLEKLTPREDLSGYEYREDYFEQQYRIALQADFQNKMKREIQRRIRRPTLTEQVEDVLFNMVEHIATAYDREQEIKKNERRDYLRSLRNPATREAKMKPLLRTETENGQVIQVVTDLEFGQMIVTDGHYIISPTIPNRVLYQHDQERRLLAEIQRKELEERELARRQPLTDKIRSAVALAKTDLKSATRQIMHDFIDKVVLLPTEPMRDKFNLLVRNGLKGLVDMGKDPEKALNSITESILDAYDVVVEGQKVIERKNKKKTVENFLEEAKLLHNPPPPAIEGSNEIDLDKEVKNNIPDAILVKLMMKVEPPALYVMRPRKTLRSKMHRLIKEAKKAMEKSQLTLGDKIKLLLPNKRERPDGMSYVAALRKLQRLDIESSADYDSIDLEKLLCSPSFDGFLHTDDVVIVPQDDDPSIDQPLVFDDSERKSFEQQFLEELSFAAGIPKENFVIEEIRRFTPNHPELVKSLLIKKTQLEQTKITIMENELIQALERLRRKALSNGILLDETHLESIPADKLLLPWSRRKLYRETRDLIKLKLREKAGSLCEVDKIYNDENSIDVTVDRADMSTQSITKVEPSQLALHTEHVFIEDGADSFVKKEVSQLISDMIDLIEKQHSLLEMIPIDLEHEDIGVFPNIMHQSITGMPEIGIAITENSHGLVIGGKFDDETHLQVEEAPQDGIIQQSSSLMGKSAPFFPSTSQLGISNPDDRKYDKSHWLSKYLKEMSPEEKRDHRIQKLPLLREHYRKQRQGYYATKYQKLKSEGLHSAEEFEEDLIDWMTPLLDKLEPYLEKANPLVSHAADSTVVLIKKLLTSIKRLSPEILKISNAQQTRLVSIDQSICKKEKDLADSAQVENSKIYLTVGQLLHEMIDKIENVSIQNQADKKDVSTRKPDLEDSAHEKLPLVKRQELFLSSDVISIQPVRNSIESAHADKSSEHLLSKDSDNSPRNPSGERQEIELDEEPKEKPEGESEDQEEEPKDELEVHQDPQDEPEVDQEEDTQDEAEVDQEEDPHDDPEEEQELEPEAEPEEDKPNNDDVNNIEETAVVAAFETIKGVDQSEKLIESESSSETPDNSDHNSISQSQGAEQGATENSVTEMSNYSGASIVDMNRRHQFLKYHLLPGTKWVDYDLQFWERVEQVDYYSSDVIETLQEMCVYIDEICTPKPVMGCEISVLINIKEEQRSIIPGLQSLCAEDVATYLKRQYLDPDSVMNECELTKEVVDVKFVPIYKTTPYFDTWNAFWVHILHPSFFHYSAKKPKSPSNDNLQLQDDGLMTLQASLPPGLKILNPVQGFDERTKEAYTAITSKPLLDKPGERQKRTDTNMTEEELAEEQQKAEEEAKLKEKDNVVDMDADEYGKEFKAKGVKIYRPNMTSLTKKDVQRLQRVYRALKDQYDTEMQKGLVNNGLRPSQFNALKDLNSAYRIFRSAKQRFERTSRNRQRSGENEEDEEEEDFTLPVLQVTRIGQDLFDSWLEEVKEEDRIRLRLKREKAEKMKIALQQEAYLRRQIEKMKIWIVENFMQYYDIHRPKIMKEKGRHTRSEKQPVNEGNDAQINGRGEGMKQHKVDPVLYPAITNLYANYFVYSHDLLELEHQLRKEIETKEEEAKLLLEATTLNLPQDSDAIDGGDTEHLFTEKEKKIMSLVAEKLEKKKITISEEKKARRLFALALQWEERGGYSIIAAASIRKTQQNADQNLSSVSGTAVVDTNDSLLETKDRNNSNFLEHDAQQIVDQVLDIINYGKSDRGEDKTAVLEAAEGASKREIAKSCICELVDFLVGVIDMQRRIETDPIPDEDDEEEVIKRNMLISDLAFRKSFMSGEEWEEVQGMLWIQAISMNPPFFDCFQNFPTLKEETILRDELVQFASILVESAPMFMNIIKALDNAKLQNELALGIQPSKVDKHAAAKKRREDRRKARELAAELTEEQKRIVERERLEEIRKAAEREKAWFMAHPHKFVRKKFDSNGKLLHPSEKITFCLVCKEKAYDYWLKSHNEAEKLWTSKIFEFIAQQVEGMEVDIGKEVESALGAQLSLQAKDLVRQSLIEEGLIKPEKSNKWFGGSKKENSSANASITTSVVSTDDGSLDEADSVDSEKRKWEEEMKKMKAVFMKKGYSLLDAYGKRIFSREPPKKKVTDSGPVETPVVVIDDALLNVVPHTISPHHHSEPIGDIPEYNGLKIRVFHRTDDGDRMRFLGMIEFAAKDIRKPPKGFRTLKLKPDPHIIDPQEVPITGSMTIQFNRTTTHKGDEIRNHYKLQIKKITDIYAIDGEKLSNPYCEIYWKGEVEKPLHDPDVLLTQPETDEVEDITDSPIRQKKKNKKKVKTEVLLMKDYSVVGQTKTKSRCVEVEYNKDDDDSSYFELPPIYTTYPIPGRGPRETDVAKNGGYVAKNQIPDPPVLEATNESDEQKVAFNPAQASLEEIIEYREHVKYKELLAVEKKIYTEAYGYIKMAEEKERCYMAREEAAQRVVEWRLEKERYAMDLRIQEVYARSFQRLLELMIMPSPILNRLRFLMGEENDGDELNYNHSTILYNLANSGDNKFISNPLIPGLHSTLSKKQKPMNNTMKLRCEDPATSQIFSVIVTPVTNKQDEQEMESNALRLVGKYAPNLMKIIDFSIHQLRTFNAQGFTAICERAAVVVMEYANGVTLHQYMVKHWDKLDNDSLREMLLQIAQGLDDLHQEGVIHRNLCPQEVLVQLQESSTSSYKSQLNELHHGQKHSLSSKPVLRIGGYWFLENPRIVDCNSSQGRADWGNRITAPPEALGIDFQDGTKRVVTEKSDIYAFGVCVFFWVTMGVHLPPEFKSTHNIEILRPMLPRKWGQWVFSLLRMCLSLYPHRRASAKELVVFLQSRMGKS